MFNSNNDYLLECLDEQKNPFLFTSNDLLKLIHDDVVTSIRTKLIMMALIGPRLSDPKAKMEEFLNQFRFADEKSKVEEILKARASTLASAAFKQTTPSTIMGGRGGRGGGRGLGLAGVRPRSGTSTADTARSNLTDTARSNVVDTSRSLVVDTARTTNTDTARSYVSNSVRDSILSNSDILLSMKSDDDRQIHDPNNHSNSSSSNSIVNPTEATPSSYTHPSSVSTVTNTDFSTEKQISTENTTDSSNNNETTDIKQDTTTTSSSSSSTITTSASATQPPPSAAVGVLSLLNRPSRAITFTDKPQKSSILSMNKTKVAVNSAAGATNNNNRPKSITTAPEGIASSNANTLKRSGSSNFPQQPSYARTASAPSMFQTSTNSSLSLQRSVSVGSHNTSTNGSLQSSPFGSSLNLLGLEGVEVNDCSNKSESEYGDLTYRLDSNCNSLPPTGASAPNTGKK